MNKITVMIYREDLLSVPGYGGAELRLPATSDEIEDAMERARVHKGQTYHLSDIEDDFGLHFDYPTFPDNPPLGELNFLAKRISGLNEDDHLFYRACVKMEKTPPDMRRLINLTYNLQDCVVAGAVPNDEALGRILVDSDMVDSLLNAPDELLEVVDYVKIGKQRRVAESGVYLENCYIENLADGFREVYDGKHLPEEPSESFGVFRLRLQKGSMEPESEKSVWLELPAGQEKIDAVLKELNVQSLDDCVIERNESAVPQFVNRFSYDADIGEIIVLADRLAQLKENGGLAKYKAAFEYTDCVSLDLAVDLTANLNCYDFLSDVTCAEDYGRQQFIEKYHIRSDDPELQLIQFDKLGYEKMRLDGVKETAYGYVRRNDSPFLQEYLKADPTELIPSM